MENENSKVILSARISPGAKQKLTEEATALGITLSEHAERILLNADKIQVNGETEQYKKEIDLLSQKVSTLKAQVSLISTPVFLKLFEQVKGLQDTVQATDGNTYTITYNSPEDLLWTMIHSFRLKQ